MIQTYSVSEAQQTILRRKLGGAAALPDAVQAGIRRIFGANLTPDEAVARILADVSERGDDALRHWTEKIDGLQLDSLLVSPDEMDAALARLPTDLVDALQLAADRIRRFHAHQPLPSWTTSELGGILGQRMTPLQRVGIYVPGGSAPLPSTLLMAAIPAKVAGVAQIVVATPPGKQDGRVPDVILAAAKLAGVDQIVRLGGAQAIAALAYGTQSIPRVDKIVGPGNLFVTLAKRQLFGQVGLDGLAGPTETIVVADDSANPAWIAADLLAQAEHDELATAILFTPSHRLAGAVEAEIARQLEELGRAEMTAQSLKRNGGIVITADLAEAVQLADEFAPEHLCLSVVEPEKWAEKINRAGGLFLGERSFEVLGDYVAGPSHIMPTGGTARYASPLNALDFVRITSIFALDDATASALSPAATRLAESEGLDAHANAAKMRMRNAECGMRNEESAIPHSASRIPNFLRPDIVEMKPYHPIFPLEVLAQRLGMEIGELVKLDANENPYGPSPKVQAALQTALLHIYPDPDSRFLREALAKYVNLAPEYLLCGAGADELIDLILRAVITPGDVVIDCPTTFGMYPFSAAVNAARLVTVVRRPDFSVDVAAVEEAVRGEPRAKVLFVCSPNNPDGSVINDEDLRRLLRLPVVVVLDEAYVEFHGHSRMQWMLEYDNLIILRTFSKWAGLAGLRVGYGAFPQWLLPQLLKIKQPYNVNVAAAQAAIASLEDVDYLLGNVQRMIAERERLIALLRTFDFIQPYPSQTNFVLCRLQGRSGLEMKQALEKRGILVRYFDKPGLRDCIRISIGRPQDTNRVIEAIKSM